ncbi:GerAB/ArcD/ProY family transporter [Chakrabartyella piscis]|uniref:GerAB/ArcD/ProY family transporter n=1 Tax=Chakrabartyella piscis TaxID=2918914 RepID=UPI00295845DD|nr:GerAB/ArcD/ProY family transporter [Chakrabartyella piscis]
MFVNNKRISKRQFSALLLFAFFGTALLFLPTELVDMGGKSGWLLLLPWSVLFLLVQVLLCVLSKRNPDVTTVFWYRYGFGRVLGTLLVLGLLCFLIFVGAMELRIFGEVISATMLSKTPIWLVLAVFVLAILPVAMGGVEVVARMAEVMFFFFLIPLVVVLVALAFSVDFGRLLPISTVDMEQFVSITSYVAPLAQGLLLTPFCLGYTKIKTGSGVLIGSVILSLFLVFALTILAFATYGTGVLSDKMLPTLQMMERIGFAHIFLSRQDLLFLWFWMVSTYLFLSMILLYALQIWKEVLPISKEKSISGGCIFFGLLLWVTSLLPEDLWSAYDLRLRYLSYGLVLFLVAIPVILLLIDIVKRRISHDQM